MKKYWNALLIALLASIFSFNEVSASSVEYELTDHPTLAFEGPSSSYQIVLKGTKFTHDTLLDYKSVNISYIIKINTPLSEGVVHLSLQDKEGFEIVKTTICSVVQGYSGSLKGNFSIKPAEYEKIADAELFMTVYSN